MSVRTQGPLSTTQDAPVPAVFESPGASALAKVLTILMSGKRITPLALPNWAAGLQRRSVPRRVIWGSMACSTIT